MAKKKDKKSKKVDKPSALKNTAFTVKMPPIGKRVRMYVEQCAPVLNEVPADADVQYYRDRLNETQEKLQDARNQLSALEALQVTYLVRLAELQGHR